MTSSSDKFEMQKEGLTRKLLIRNISVHDDGEYTCSLGDQESTAEVTVVGEFFVLFIFLFGFKVERIFYIRDFFYG